MKSPKLGKGFTLIELLIVVAIIAILAAIAVPNFLEAQTRSKVSRVKSDQRTLATALEAYRIDGNAYPPIIAPTAGIPPGNIIDGASVFNPGSSGVSSRYIRLTTPISYITSVFRDPFINPSVGWAKEFLTDTITNPVSSAPPPQGNGSGYDTYDYVDARTFRPGSKLPGRTDGAARCSGAQWHVVSAGPDMINSYGGGTTGTATRRLSGMDYDPTNGTISMGDVVRIGGGPGEVNGTDKPVYDRVNNKYN